MWFTPLHNAVANGAHELAAVMLDSNPAAIHFTTGDGRQPLHVLCLCDDATDRLATLEVLLQRRAPSATTPRGGGGGPVLPDLTFAEPFFGNTALHVAAKEGHAEIAIRLLEQPQAADESLASKPNDAGRNALEEVKFELERLEREGQPATAMRRAKLSDTIEKMEIAYIAFA